MLVNSQSHPKFGKFLRNVFLGDRFWAVRRRIPFSKFQTILFWESGIEKPKEWEKFKALATTVQRLKVLCWRCVRNFQCHKFQKKKKNIYIYIYNMYIHIYISYHKKKCFVHETKTFQLEEWHHSPPKAATHSPPTKSKSLLCVISRVPPQQAQGHPTR